MIITKLLLHNFGIYAGDNTFGFNDDKPVVLIGGLNGRGKTTFLEAILLVLYGTSSFAFLESAYKSYSKYLKAHINTNDGSGSTFVQIEFSLNEEGELNHYTVKRSWNQDKKLVKETIEVIKNGSKNEFLAQNWAMFIESILPSALSNLYFFDGEKIAELAENEDHTKITNAIKSLLGIHVLDRLDSDLAHLIKRMSKAQSESCANLQLGSKRALKEQKDNELSQLDAKILALDSELATIDKKILKKQQEFDTKGGKVAEQSRELYSEKIALSVALENLNNEYIDLASGELPLNLVRDLLEMISQNAYVENKNRSVKAAADQLDEMLQKYSASCQDGLVDIQRFIDFFKQSATYEDQPMVFSLSDQAIAQNTVLLNGKLHQAYSEYLNHKRLGKKYAERIREIDNYLAIDIDEKTIQKIYKRLFELQNRKTELETEIAQLKKQRQTVNGEFLAAQADFKKAVESSLSLIEQQEEEVRTLQYAYLAQNLTQQYRTMIQHKKIDLLSDRMTACYKKLLGKEDLIDQIVIDPESLEYRYLSKNGENINISILSAGEKQLMVIAMLWALTEASQNKLPVIIDTPLARLDSVHRTTLIERYFPYASDQTIILSTDSELDSKYYPIIKNHVSSEYTIIYDEMKKCSYIEQGYFKGVIG